MRLWPFQVGGQSVACDFGVLEECYGLSKFSSKVELISCEWWDLSLWWIMSKIASLLSFSANYKKRGSCLNFDSFSACVLSWWIKWAFGFLGWNPVLLF
jgi:hypothetical protein